MQIIIVRKCYIYQIEYILSCLIHLFDDLDNFFSILLNIFGMY